MNYFVNQRHANIKFKYEDNDRYYITTFQTKYNDGYYLRETWIIPIHYHTTRQYSELQVNIIGHYKNGIARYNVG